MAGEDLPEFDVKKGPGRQLTEEERQDIMRDEASGITHRAHLRHTWRHGWVPRVFGDLERTPHTAVCHRMETAISSDIRLMNGKARRKERSAEMRSSSKEIPDTAKRRMLEDIDGQVMKEEDPSKLAELVDRNRAESGSHQSASYAEVGVEKITESNVAPWEFLEAVGCDKR